MTSELQALMFMSCNVLFLLYTRSSTLLSVKSSLSSLEVSLFEASFWRKYSILGHFEIKPTNADTLNSLIFLIILMCNFILFYFF